MRFWLCFAVIAFVGCSRQVERHNPDPEYLLHLQERRKVNDLDRLVLVARCGEVIDLWQVAIAQDAAAGVMVSDFAERLRSSERWAEFRERKKMQDDLMRALMDPPPRFRTQYEKVLKQYGLLSRLLALLEKPTGSLVSYTAEVRAIASEYDQLKAELDVSLPVIELSPVFDRPKA